MANNANNGSKKTEHILSLEDDPKEHQVTKDNSISFDLMVQPSTAGSAKFKQTVRVLRGSETTRQLVRWGKDVDKVFFGSGATTAEEQLALIKALMKETPWATFNAELQLMARNAHSDALEEAKDDDETADGTVNQETVAAREESYYHTTAMIKKAKNLLIQHLAPRQALAKAKKALRRDMRKPRDMGVREYYRNLCRINNEELTSLPPAFNDTQKMADSDITDIILAGTPKSWQREMDRQGFDPWTKRSGEVIAWMENIEASEEFEANRDNKKSDKTKKQKKSPASESKTVNNRTEKYCKIHGKNYTHSTAECKVLNNGDSKNKTWSRKSEEAKKASRKDLNALLEKKLSKVVKKQLASVEKKRKSDDSDSDEECHLLDALSGKLDGFNYEDMEGLSLEDQKDSDEFSV